MSTKYLPWLRLYADIVDDDKINLLAFEDRWHFVVLLALKREGVLDSDAPHRSKRIANKLQLQLNACDEVKRRLIDVGLIDENWQPIAWEKNQFDSDAGSTLRMRRHRSKKMQPGCDVTVTSQIENVTSRDASPPRHCDVPDKSKRREEEEERTSETGSASFSRQAICKKDTPPLETGGVLRGERAVALHRPSKQIPKSYQPSTQLRAWAATEAPLVNFAHELAVIRDHEFKTAHRDWDAVLRNWLRRAQQWAENQQLPASPKSRNGTAPQRTFRDDDDSMDGIEL